MLCYGQYYKKKTKQKKHHRIDFVGLYIVSASLLFLHLVLFLLLIYTYASGGM